VSSLALDPIEKKPLARYCPGSRILSVGGLGCNLDCAFCQNASIGRRGCAGGAVGPRSRDGRRLSPPELTSLAQQAATQKPGNIGLAYTYNEPLVCYEFVRDCANLIHDAGMRNVLVTNGYLNEAPWSALLGLLDAANIDLKGFTQPYYDTLDAPQGLKTVMRNIMLAVQAGVHVEVTTLVVAGLNDSPDEMDALASWLASVDRSVPLHLTRCFPQHRMTDRPATPASTLRALAAVARRHLDDVLLGNL
jgi:pyruvate formate lyase activating enzyme